ncbi:CLUMA_CG010342, isoform A [Clunio marinus]|uniref:CLUMA_CG010342, isoform A n=1 Tax=Clunio marinus TaxID=568069 RepID=A0A1J1I9Q3_9DIPT|nr:CLUMA_CG010342, isoform A [Clunio marinus]
MLVSKTEHNMDRNIEIVLKSSGENSFSRLELDFSAKNGEVKVSVTQSEKTKQMLNNNEESESIEECEIEIFVKFNFDYQATSFHVKPSTLIEDLKDMIQVVKKIPSHFQILRYDGRVLMNGFSLSEANVKDKSIITGRREIANKCPKIFQYDF